jgi:hypothetical protein
MKVRARASCAKMRPGTSNMKTAKEYRQLAEECRGLARSAQNEEHRAQLLKMAEGWDDFARERERRDVLQAGNDVA